jgi:hypothetical protein
MSRDYSALMNAAFQLEQYSGYLTGEDLKEQGKVQEAFNSARNLFVYEALKTGEPSEFVKQSVVEELAAMEEMQPQWGGTYAYVREELCNRLDQESGKSPLLRKIVRWTPAALGVVAVVVYFGIRFTSGVDISAPIDTKLGLQQRAAAAEKVIRYDDLMGARVRRGGFFKDILFWPIEPSENEIKAAGEFVSVSLEGYELLAQQQQICGTLYNGSNGELSQEQIEFVGEMADEIQKPSVKWEVPPVMTMLTPIKAKYPCK